MKFEMLTTFTTFPETHDYLHDHITDDISDDCR